MKTITPTKARQKAILEIMNQGIESPTEIVSELESQFGIVTTRQTVYRDISSGIQPITGKDIEGQKVTMLDNIDELARVLHKKAINGNIPSANAYSKLQETRARVLAKIVEIQSEMNRKERPIYQIIIGDFPETKIKPILKKKEINNE